MTLTDSDARFLRAGGTTLAVNLHPKWIQQIIGQGEPRKSAFAFTKKDGRQKRRHDLVQWLKSIDPSGDTGLFTLTSDCGYLKKKNDGTTVCGVYDDPRRPATCRKFKPGEYNCKKIRADARVGGAN